MTTIFNLCFLSLLLWMSIKTIPDVAITRDNYSRINCNLTFYLSDHSCCEYPDCSTCTEATGLNIHSCNNIAITYNTTQQYCIVDEPICCKKHCDICTSGTKVKRKRPCNCECVSSVEQQLCSYKCGKCLDTSLLAVVEGISVWLNVNIQTPILSLLIESNNNSLSIQNSNDCWLDLQTQKLIPSLQNPSRIVPWSTFYLSFGLVFGFGIILICCIYYTIKMNKIK